MRKKSAQTLLICVPLIGFVSITMAVQGEFEALLGWWMSIGILLPPLLWALKTRYVTLRTICLLTFATQFVTLPYFYINRDYFGWGHVKPFYFTAVEAWPILAKVMLFLFSLIVFFTQLYRVRLIGGSESLRSRRFLLPASPLKFRSFLSENAPHKKHGRRTSLYTFLLIILITILVPLNLWMFSRGISIVGVEPPRLPYKMSGILHYLTKYIIPLLLAYLYWNTKRGIFPMALMLGYALLLGLSSISRSSLVFVMLPVFAAAWFDRRLTLLIFAGLGTVIGYSLVSFSRDFVYVITSGNIEAVTNISVLSILTKIMLDVDIRLLEGAFILKAFERIFNRIEGFENLVMSQFYDPNAVNGPWDIFIGMIWQGFTDIDLDLHHLQWQGNVLPEGFVNGGGLLSSVVIIGNVNLLWILAIAVVVACILIILEKSVNRAVVRYGLSDLVALQIIGLLSIFFFIGGGGGRIFVYPWLLLIVVSWLPPLYRFNKMNSRWQRSSQVPKHQVDVVTSGNQIGQRIFNSKRSQPQF